MKTIFSLALLLITSFTLSAQTVEWGVKNISSNAKYEPSVIAWNSEGIFCFADDNSNYYLEKLDSKTFKSQYQTEFEEPKFGKYKSTLEEVIYANGNFIVFFSYYDKQKETHFIYAYEYNGENGRSTGKKEKIFEAEVEKRKEKGHFLVLVSEDNSKILVNHYAYNKKTDEFNDYYLLLNADLETITTRTESFDVADAEYVPSDYTLNNDGTLYYWKSYDDKSSIVSYDGNRDYDKWEETIKLDARPNSYSVGGAYSFDQNGDFVIAGIWATRPSKNASREEKLKTHYKGTYYIKIDKTSKEVQQSVISEFSKEDIKEIIPSEKVYGIGKKLKYSVFEVIPTNNGGTILVGEKYQRVWRSSDNGTTITTYYADIIVSFINPEGEVQWSKVIPKSQLHSVSLNYITMFFSLKRLLMGSEYFSYIPLIQDDMFYLLYNDHPKNLLLTKLTEKQKGITQNANGTIPVIYRFDLADGSFKKELYREVDAKGLYMKPAFSFYNQQTSETLIFSQKSKEYMFGVFK